MQRFAIVLFVLVVIVAVIWTGGWFYLAGQIRGNVMSLAEADGVSDPKITCVALDVSGFPLSLNATCTKLTLIEGDLTAELPALTAHYSVLQPSRLTASAASPLLLTDAFSGNRQRLDWQALDFEGGIVDFQRLGDMSINLDEAALYNTVPDDQLVASTEHLDAHLLDISEQHDAAKGLAALSLFAEASAIDAPGFTIADGSLDIEAELNGLPDQLAAYSDLNLMKSLQAAGGKLKLVGIRGQDETSSFDIEGLLGLDDGMRADGQLHVMSTGLVERLGGLVPPDIQPMILGQQAEDGSYTQTLTLKSGVIFAGIIPVGMVPPLQ